MNISEDAKMKERNEILKKLSPNCLHIRYTSNVALLQCVSFWVDVRDIIFSPYIYIYDCDCSEFSLILQFHAQNPFFLGMPTYIWKWKEKGKVVFPHSAMKKDIVLICVSLRLIKIYDNLCLLPFSIRLCSLSTIYEGEKLIHYSFIV